MWEKKKPPPAACPLQDGTYVTPPFKIPAPGRGPWSLLGARLKISKGGGGVKGGGVGLLGLERWQNRRVVLLRWLFLLALLVAFV